MAKRKEPDGGGARCGVGVDGVEIVDKRARVRHKVKKFQINTGKKGDLSENGKK